MRMWFLIALAAVSLHPAAGDEVNVRFEQANQFYRAGDFRDAAELYESIIANGFESPGLFFNLGNCYFKLQNIAGAILNYERARRLAPHDEDILYNLRLSGLKVVDRIEPIPKLFFAEWWESFVNVQSSDGWAALGIAALWGLTVSSGVLMIARHLILRRICAGLVLLLAFAGALSYAAVIQRHSTENNDREAIIFSPSVAGKSSPDIQSIDLFVIHEGVNVELLDSVGDWKKIRLADGKIGWILSQSLKII